MAFTTVVYENKIWIMGGCANGGGFKNDVWYSSDGANWTQATNKAEWKARSGHSAIVYNDKIWLYGGSGSEFVVTGADITASDRYTKTQPDIHITGYLYSDVWNSSDGVHWEQVTDEAPWICLYESCAVVFNNELWVLGGSRRVEPYADSITSSIIWHSADGIKWQEVNQVPWPGRFAYATVVFDDRIWIILGWNGNLSSEIWNSKDGHSWNLSPSNVK